MVVLLGRGGKSQGLNQCLKQILNIDNN